MTKPAGLSLIWTQHLKDEEERQKFRSYVLASIGVLNRLEDILTQRASTCEVFKEEDYKSPSWAYQQADRNGYVRALRETIDLLKGVDQYDRN